MISISERLRARLEPVGDGTGRWRKDGLCQEAADTIDALLAALDEVRERMVMLEMCENINLSYITKEINAALAKAKGKQE